MAIKISNSTIIDDSRNIIDANDINITGISTLGTIEISSGIVTSTTGIVTYYGDHYGVFKGTIDSSVTLESANYATVAGVSTYANVAGVSTDVIGGIASVTSLNVSGVSTFIGIGTFGNDLYVNGNLGITSTGSETNPSLVVGSATSTGIYSPGADQLALSTNGTGKLFIDSAGKVTVKGAGTAAFVVEGTAPDNSLVVKGSTGNVGLGTSSPQATLDVVGSSYPNFLTNRSLSSGGSGAAPWTAARIQATTTEQMSAGFGVQQEFALRDADAVDNTVASILVSRDGADNSGSFAIRTASAGTLGTRLHVTSGGNVGVGTASPSYRLHAVAASEETNPESNAGAYWPLLNSSSTLNTCSALTLGTNNDLGTALVAQRVGANNEHVLKFQTRNSSGSLGTRMTLTGSGLLGVGTASPTQLLSLAGSSANILLTGTSNSYTTYNINASNVGYVGDANWTFGGSSSDFGVRATNNLVFGIGAYERARIDSSGNVGLGTSSPTARLSVNATTSSYVATAFNVGEPSTSTGRQLFMGYNTADSVGFIQAVHWGSEFKPLILNPNGGRVGVGTASPLTKLDVRSGVITAGSNSSPDGTEILRGYYSATDGALAVIGTEYSSGGIVIGSAVKPSTSASDAFLSSTTVNVARGAYTIAGNTHKWYIGAVQTVAENNSVSTSEVMRIDSSGRLLVGTSTALSAGSLAQYARTQIVSNTSGSESAGLLALARSEAATAITSGELIGGITFSDNAGNTFAQVIAESDAAASSGDYPGRLVFSTTADGASSPTERMRIANNGIVTIKTSANDIVVGGTLGTTIAAATRAGIHFGTPSSLIPTDGDGTLTDNTCSLGNGVYRWSTVYAGTGTINTSDATLKQDIADLGQAELNVAATIKTLIKRFRFVDAVTSKGDDARIHVGVVAQEVEQAFVDEGLDPHRYGMFCEDTLEDGSKRLGIRYDELLAFVIAAL